MFKTTKDMFYKQFDFFVVYFTFFFFFFFFFWTGPIMGLREPYPFYVLPLDFLLCLKLPFSIY